MLFRRPAARPLIIAEHFVAPAARLSGLWLPLDVVARRPAARLRIVLLAEDGPGHRACTLLRPRLDPGGSLRLQFAPFASPAGATFLLGVLDLAEGDETPLAADVQAIRAAVSGRSPIRLEVCGEGDPRLSPDLLAGEEGIATFRCGGSRASEIHMAHGLDAFWCDAHGLYLRGWIHAHEHRVRALRIESAGRSARVETFSDRPDLLVHYPEHEHVRHAGFAVYLACPPGHPVRLTLETDGGVASFPLPLPEGPLPVWPAEPGDGDEISPMLRRFAELANAGGGRVLQIGARSLPDATPDPARRLLRGRLIGLDIHPGHRVDLVGDAHGLGRFLRGGSLGAVFSSAVLEHLEAPWLLAAEINRVLAPGGLVYQQAPGAWPAHAQPTDFWRMSAEGLKVLFGPETGFEVLEARDEGAAALLPTPGWRAGYLDMPTVPVYTMAEVLARKVAEIPPGAVAWPLDAARSEGRSKRYPVEGLHPHRAEREEP
jgi:SAM-dependent methyltransferase